jgi:hypothetical protein
MDFLTERSRRWSPQYDKGNFAVNPRTRSGTLPDMSTAKISATDAKTAGTIFRPGVPLNLDGFLFDPKWEDWKKQQLTARLAANFIGWENDHTLFDRELQNVVRTLRADDGGREKPPKPKL